MDRQILQKEALAKLEAYVNQPSCTWDKADADAMGLLVARDFAALGMQVTRHESDRFGATIEATAGSGQNRIVLNGHMDTVFPHREWWPFRLEGDTAYGPGVMDMKGGLVVLYYAVRAVLEKGLPSDAQLTVIVNPDEEIGSDSSHDLLESRAKDAFAALFFEPMRPGLMLTAQRKGVLAFEVTCTGQRGHAGNAYLTNASAIEQLCRVIETLYALRDDSRDLSINIGVVQGGTAENIIAGEAHARGEARFYDPHLRDEIEQRLLEIGAQPGIPGTTTKITIGETGPAFKADDKCKRLFAIAREIASGQGRSIQAVSCAGAGDIGFVGLTGIAALDGLGIVGEGAHTKEERADVTSLVPNIELAAALIEQLLQNPDAVR